MCASVHVYVCFKVLGDACGTIIIHQARAQSANYTEDSHPTHQSIQLHCLVSGRPIFILSRILADPEMEVIQKLLQKGWMEITERICFG